jgi:hypothetical protein
MTYPWLPLIDAAMPRFIAKLDTSRGALGCWPWLGAKSRGQGNDAWYGSFAVGRLDGKPIIVRAHIFAAAAAGAATPGLHRDHLCLGTLCMNPIHIEEVAPAENARRRWISTPTWRRAA